MKKAEIIEALAEKTGLTKADVARVYEGTFELFKEELETDYKNALGSFESISFKDINGNVKDGLLTTDVEAFLYNEGYITFNRKKLIYCIDEQTNSLDEG